MSKERSHRKMRGHQEKGEKPPRGVGKRFGVRLTISLIFG